MAEMLEKSSRTVPVSESIPIGDISNVRSLGNGIHWVGADVGGAFRCNPYVIVDGNDAVVLDPGGLLDAEAVIARIRSVVDPKKIRYIIAHHQDPDVCSGVNAFRDIVAPECKIVCHSRMSVLIAHCGSGFPFVEVDRTGWQLSFGNGRRLTFAHTPYLHSPGAIVTYDAQSRTSFTSDLFGAISNDWELYASEATLEGIHAFHVAYMPSREILENGLDAIRALGPISRIAPQHGSIVEGNLVERFFEQLGKMKVGIYADQAFSRRVAQQREAQRMKQLVDNAVVRFIVGDATGNVAYLNPAARELLRTMQDALPCAVDALVGRSMEMFHGKPELQRKMTSDPKSALPYHGLVDLADRRFRVNAFGIWDEGGEYMGPALTWDEVTDVQRSSEALSNVVDEVTPTAGNIKTKSAGIAEQTNNVAAAAEQLSVTMSLLDSSAKTSQNNINHIVSATEEMTATVTEIARNAEHARVVAQNAVRSVSQASEKVNALGMAAREISLVTETIVEIADQTKLLALNATIEAARAGEAGKGFAVVASEVKELAKQTNMATADIRKKIEAIQTSSESTIAEIQAISGVINEVSDFVSSIATATEEQSATTSDIAANIAEVSEGIGSMAGNVAQAAAVTTEVAQSIGKVRLEAVEIDEIATRLTGSVHVLEATGQNLRNVISRSEMN